MATETFKGVDGVERPLEEHRAHLQATLDASVDPDSFLYDEGLASKIRTALHELPKRARTPADVKRVAEHKPPAEPMAAPPRYALVLIDADAIADVEAFRQAGPESVLSMTKKTIAVTSLMRRVLRAVLTARIEREAP